MLYLKSRPLGLFLLLSWLSQIINATPDRDLALRVVRHERIPLTTTYWFNEGQVRQGKFRVRHDADWWSNIHTGIYQKGIGETINQLRVMLA
jgi:hypothetical protein